MWTVTLALLSYMTIGVNGRGNCHLPGVFVTILIIAFASMVFDNSGMRRDPSQIQYRDKVRLWADHQRTEEEVNNHLNWAPRREDWPALPDHDRGYWRELSAAVITLVQLPST